MGGKETEEEQRSTAAEQAQPEGMAPQLPWTDTNLASLRARPSPALPQAPETKQLLSAVKKKPNSFLLTDRAPRLHPANPRKTPKSSHSLRYAPSPPL